MVVPLEDVDDPQHEIAARDFPGIGLDRHFDHRPVLGQPRGLDRSAHRRDAQQGIGEGRIHPRQPNLRSGQVLAAGQAAGRDQDQPLDPRLLRYARSTRGFIALAVVLGVITAVLVITQARLLSDVIVSVTSTGADWSDVRDTVVVIAAVFACRALVSWLAEVAAVRASARAKQQLRETTIEHVLALGPAGPGAHSPGETAALITRGIDALDGYYARYLPQLVLAVIVPVAVLLHGHTHKPAVHDLGDGLSRWVLSDWHADSQPPRLEVLSWQREHASNPTHGLHRHCLATN